MAVEFTSLSKTYAMPGWRMGFAVGNTRLIDALTRIKSYLDYGAFTPVQVAAAAALNGPQDCIAEIRGIYKSAPRRAGRRHGPRRLGDPLAARDHVRLGAGARSPSPPSAPWASPRSCCARPRSPSPPASASASTARATSGSAWSRTSTASARPPAASAASCRTPTPSSPSTTPRKPPRLTPDHGRRSSGGSSRQVVTRKAMMITTSSGAPSSQAMRAGMGVPFRLQRRPKVPNGTLRSRWSPPAAAAR